NVKRAKLLRPIDFIFKKFNGFLARFSGRYANIVKKRVRRERSSMAFYAVLVVLAIFLFNRLPGGFIPPQDQAYFITIVQLPPGSDLDRTDEVAKEVTDKFLQVDGVANLITFVGMSGATQTNAPNQAVLYIPLKSFE